LVKIHQAKKQGGDKKKKKKEKKEKKEKKKKKEQVPESPSRLMTSLTDGRKKGEALNMSRKCCHSRVYHQAFRKAIAGGKGKIDAKDIARKAGTKFYEEFDKSYCKAGA
jgi:hypothetical protein